MTTLKSYAGPEKVSSSSSRRRYQDFLLIRSLSVRRRQQVGQGADQLGAVAAARLVRVDHDPVDQAAGRPPAACRRRVGRSPATAASARRGRVLAPAPGGEARPGGARSRATARSSRARRPSALAGGGLFVQGYAAFPFRIVRRAAATMKPERVNPLASA
jgi:hypothetical protein